MTMPITTVEPAVTIPKLKMTFEEYVVFDEAAEGRYEFYNGEIEEMSSGTQAHGDIAGNLYLALRLQLKESPCRPYIFEMKTVVDASGRYVYPDVAVICGKSPFIKKDRINDATVIIEVLSDSTEGKDRSRKFQDYQRLASLQSYVLVAQDEMKVEVFTRTDSNKWLYEWFSQPTEKLVCESIHFSISLADIYESVDFNTESNK